MIHYILKPKDSFLERAENFNMIVEGKAILGIFTDYRFEKDISEIKEYRIQVEDQIIEFNLKKELEQNINDYLSIFWEIEKR